MVGAAVASAGTPCKSFAPCCIQKTSLATYDSIFLCDIAIYVLKRDVKLKLIDSIFYRLDALPDAQPTVSKHWRQSQLICKQLHYITFTWWLQSDISNLAHHVVQQRSAFTRWHPLSSSTLPQVWWGPACLLYMALNATQLKRVNFKFLSVCIYTRKFA